MSESGESARKSWLALFGWLSAAIAFAAILAAFLWCYQQSAEPVSPRTRLYVEQLLRGHAFLGETTSSIDKFDTSPFRGKIYLYFGLTPFLTAWLPLRALFGIIPSEAALVFAYSIAGALFYGAATVYALPKEERRQRGWWVALVMLAIAFGTGPFVLLRRPALYEVEIAAAFCFVGLFLAAIAASSKSPRFANLLLALAATALGLAIGARPNLALVAPFFLLWVFPHNRREPQRGASAVGEFTCALVPLVVIGIGLAAFNWVRFQNPFEFGFGHQARAVDTSHSGVFSAANVPYNFYRYLFGGVHWQPYFPFVAGITPGPLVKPIGHDEVDQLYGLAWSVPLIWTALAFCMRRCACRESQRFALVVALTQLGVLCALGGGAYRYVVEVAAPLSWSGLIAVVYWMTATPRPRLPWAACALTMSATVVSVVLGALQNFALYGILQNVHHSSFVKLARAWNEPVFFAQHLFGEAVHVLSLRISFPNEAAGVNEPLLVTGDPGQQDFLYVYYVSEKELQIGFESIGRGGTLSPPLTVDRTKPHELIIAYGGFIPPGAPLLKSFPAANQTEIEHALTVLLDGQPVLDGWADFHAVKNRFQLGASHDEPAFGTAFHGSITLAPARARAEFWSNRFTANGGAPREFSLTKSRLPAGAREPLASFGLRNQGALYFLEHSSNETASVGCIVSFAGAATEHISAPILWKDGQLRRITIIDQNSFGLKNVDNVDGSNVPSARAAVIVDGSAVLTFDFAHRPFAPSTLAIGENRLGLSGVAPSLLIPAQTVSR